jgi:hypothetical protein
MNLPNKSDVLADVTDQLIEVLLKSSAFCLNFGA